MRLSRGVTIPRRALGVALGALFLTVMPAIPAAAATITVNTPEDELNADGDCSLREAIQAANTDTEVDECAAGLGPDTINLPTNTYPVGLPLAELVVTQTVTIAGEGAAKTIIQGSGDTRLFTISPGGAPTTVEISGVTLRDADPASPGGAVLSSQENVEVVLTDSVVTGNSAVGNGGGLLVNGALNMSNTTVSENSATGAGGGICCNADVTLTNSIVSGNEAQSGGGIFVQDETLTLTDTSVTGNTADTGAGIWYVGSTITATGGEISDNIATGWGGGVYFIGGTFTADGTAVSGNGALFGGGISSDGTGSVELTSAMVDGNSAPNGAGIWNQRGTLSVTGTTVSGNVGNGIDNGGTATIDSSTISGNDGEGVHSWGSFTITDSAVNNNTSAGVGVLANPGSTATSLLDEVTVTGNTGAFGGGIYSGTFAAPDGGSSDFTILNSTIAGNTVSGGINNFAEAGVMTIENTTISGNTANSGGGGLTNSGTAVVTNSTISGNAGDGGAIRMHGGTLTLNFTTITGNSSTSGPGGIQSGGHTVNMGSSILANSIGPGGECAGSQITSTGYNLIENAGTCTIVGDMTGNITGQDPLLGPLQDNGGPTLTHDLLDGSPAIDAANPNCPPPATDQRGEARPIGPSCDIGAVESESQPPPASVAISINDVSVSEGTGTTTRATLTVSLSQASAQQVTVNFATVDGAATQPSDYRSRSGIIGFPAGVTTRQIQVPIVSDSAPEPDETFSVILSNPVGATIADGEGVVTIVDDDQAPGLPAISVNDVSQNEGSGTRTNFVFTVSLSQPSTQQVTVQWSTADGTATASSGDYRAQGLTTITFNPGETSKAVTVAVRGDSLPEPNETFFVNLSSPTNATIADGQGVGTILNDD